MTNILFDIECTQPSYGSQRHGGGKYGEIVFYRMCERRLKFHVFYDSVKWLNPEVKEACEKHGVVMHDVRKEQLADIIRSHDIDNVYSALPGSMVRQEIPEGVRVIGTFHGPRQQEQPIDWHAFLYRNTLWEHTKNLVWELWPSLMLEHRKRKWRRTYMYTPMEVVTVSEHSAAAVKCWFPEYKREVRVFFSPNTSRKGTAAKDNKGERYVLLVSGNRWGKNNLRVIEAFDRLVDNDLARDIRVKVTGAKDRNFHYKVRHPERFDFLGYVDEDELDRLYANAWLFAYPTLNEGFGYPPLEALRYRVPVIASPFSSVSELLEEGALYFNPFSVEEIMNRILLMQDEKRYRKYVERGYNKYLEIKARQDRDLDLLIDFIMQEGKSGVVPAGTTPPILTVVNAGAGLRLAA